MAPASTVLVRVARAAAAKRYLAGIVLLVALVACRDSPSPDAAPLPTPAAAQHEAAQQQAVILSAGARAYPKLPDEELRRRLSPIAYRVTQHAATEPAFNNEFWDHHAQGLYVDVTSGEPLFSSRDKFDSGTGWPSFTRPVEPARVVTAVDSSQGMDRTEVRSLGGNAHLGHVFDDGPAPDGLRYCINSAALRFIPVEALAREGYGGYVQQVEHSGKTATAVPSAPAANACTAPAPGEQPGCQATLETAVLAGGCFWGMEEILRKIPGVVSTEVGYTGGTSASPRYDDVHTGSTGHAEAVRIIFDPSELSYADLLEKWFFRMHDPTTANRQGNDVGTQYRSAIFTTSTEQRETAERMKRQVEQSQRWPAPVTTEIIAAGAFTLAEDEHQDYLQKHPDGYTCHYLRD